ncbi:hypothetical protein [Achromobacter kerstersii]|uniref:Uncharacterized protein n=1 Tax=Achromobacter kerstersii TaxID=1353890 RepID=A0A6S6ZLG5_9BURK|nr:hypothetical protein [Achromobacter kerstersii]CAB3681277.1 hypothetical protein LMG3441_01608 [Achromobacter kerstersii]
MSAPKSPTSADAALSSLMGAVISSPEYSRLASSPPPSAPDEKQIARWKRSSELLDAIQNACWDVRFITTSNGDAGDCNIGIEIVAHFMGAPHERVIGEDWSENVRAALEQAMTAEAYPPERPERPAPASGDSQTSAARDVLAERQRQITAEGWTPDHDDQHDTGELASAAASYAQCAGLQREGAVCENAFKAPYVENWPWSEYWWKPSTDPRRNLVKAGALILAEIERLDRAAIAAQPGKGNAQ